LYHPPIAVNTTRWLSQRRRDELRLLAARSHQVVLFAAVTGAITGFAVAGFDRLVVDALFDHLADAPLWLLGALPGVGLLIAAAARATIGRGVSPATADDYLHAFHDSSHRLSWRHFTARMVAATATLGFGGPMGLEGPSLYIGATAGASIQQRFRRSFRDSDRRLLLTAGAAAGVSAIFKAPATGAVFALEVPYRGDLARRMLLPALVASATGYLAFAAVNGTTPLFAIDATPGFKLRDLLGVVVLGVTAGIGARAFAWMLRSAKRWNGRTNIILAAVAGGVAVAALFAVGRGVTGESLVIGPGYPILAWAGDPTTSAWLLAAMLGLRCVATSATVAGGGVGGLFIPLVVGGALTGGIAGHVFNRQDLTLFIVIGVAAFLGAGYRVPLAAVMFVAETTGRPSFVVPGLLAAVAAELVMGGSSVSDYQMDPVQAMQDDSAATTDP
jgi:CIC family chloride channel protein